jgi:hypothetical protein
MHRKDKEKKLRGGACYSLSSERLVYIKFYVEKVVPNARLVKFEIYHSSSNIFALKLCSN